MAKSLKTAYLIALVVLGIFFVFYFMNSSEGFYANNILTSSTQSSAGNCFSYCNGDSSSGTYKNYVWCSDNGFVSTSGATTSTQCTTNNSCKCISKRT